MTHADKASDFVCKVSKSGCAYSWVDAQCFRKIALQPTLAAICQQIFDAGFDVRNQFAARRVLSARDLGYWNEFIACALPSDWLIWAAEECVSHYMKIEMIEYHNEALNALKPNVTGRGW